jgi:hypothetical protein
MVVMVGEKSIDSEVSRQFKLSIEATSEALRSELDLCLAE